MANATNHGIIGIGSALNTCAHPTQFNFPSRIGFKKTILLGKTRRSNVKQEGSEIGIKGSVGLHSPCIRTVIKNSKMKPAILLSFFSISLVNVRGKVILQDINEAQNKKCTLFITCDINTSLKMLEEYR